MIDNTTYIYQQTYPKESGDSDLKRSTVIFNPKAGRGAYRRRLPNLKKHLASVGFTANIYIVEDEHAISREVGTHINNTDLFVAAGGDGTVNAVAQALLAYEERPPLGILPLGTGNDYSRGLGISRRIHKAVEVLSTGRHCDLDVGTVKWKQSGADEWRDHIFVNALGFGIEAKIADDVHAAGYQSWIKSYVSTLLQTLQSWNPPELRISSGDEPRQIMHDGRLLAGSISNGPTSGGGFRLSPDANLSDGLLDLFVIPPRSPARIIRMLPWLILGKHNYFAEVKLHQAEHFTIHSPAGLSFHVDGEVLTRDATELSINLLPKALTVICP